MRIKIRCGKSRLSKSAPPPPPDKDDDNGEDSIDEIKNEPRDDIARDSADETEVDKEKQCVSDTGDIGGGDCMDIDWTEKGTCIKCDSDGQVLICSEIGCPVALHEKCMGCEPKIDNAGNFYCPYCSYKRAVAQMQELRKEANVAKKALLNFINSKVGGHVKEKDRRAKRKEPDISAPARDENQLDHVNCPNSNEDESQSVQVEEDQHRERDDAAVADDDPRGRKVLQPETGPVPSVVRGGDDIHHRQEEKTPSIALLKDSMTKEKSNEAKICESRQFEIVEDGGRIQAEDPGEVDDNRHEEIVKGHQQAEPSNACHVEEEMTVDAAVDVLPKGRRDGVKVSEENQGRREEEEQMQPEAQETTVGGVDTPRETRGHRYSRRIRDSISEPKVPENVNAGLEFSDMDNEARSMRRSHVKKRIKSTAQHRISPRKSSSQRDTTAEENARNQIKKVNTPKKSTPGAEENARNQIKKVNTPKKSTPGAEENAGNQNKKVQTSKNSIPAAEENASNQIEKVTSTKKLGKHQDSAKPIRSPTIANARRKRLFWTTEEEDMLKEAVYKFSTSVNKNLPWRKILEFGRHVFDATRTPGDLKCKWRNITAKESPS